jgi:hypothetical protein
LLSWTSPWWLSGLALLPLIRWLHRGGRHRRAVRVSRLGLWKESAALPPARGETRPPDPAWRRRALLAALMLAALAQPQLTRQVLPVTIWVDDSLSMLMREAPLGASGASARGGVPALGAAGGAAERTVGESASSQAAGDAGGPTRLAEGLARARALLAQVGHGDVALRALSDPWRDRGPLDDAAIAGIVAQAGRKETAAPPLALLRSDRRHWLITDGADPALRTWPGGRNPDRVLQVGQGTRNVGVARLAARRHGGDPERADVLVVLINGGSQAETRELVLADASGRLDRSVQRLEPGATAVVQMTVPLSEGWRVRLSPGDALAEDDSLALDAAPLGRRRIAVDAACTGELLAAVRAHPALLVADHRTPGAAVTLDCSGAPAATAGPVLRVRAEHAPTAASGVLTWSDALATSRRVALGQVRLLSAARLAVGPADRVLLGQGGDALIVARGGMPPRLDTSLDFAAMAPASGAELPLLLNLMLEQLLGEALLDAVAVADRGTAASRVAPRDMPSAPAEAAADPTAGATDELTRPMLLLAMLVLLWECAALLRQARRLREPPRSEAA